VRLLAPITSYDRAGSAFRAAVIGPVDRDGSPHVPAGTILHGRIRKAKSVGLGLRRERAVIDIEFESCELQDGRTLPCPAELQTIDNAREEVLAENRIRGVLAASYVHSWLSGVWYRPAPALIHRSAAGLTGASGVINTRYAPGPAGAAIVITSRLLLFRMPEPEIELPAGTEMIIRLSKAGYHQRRSALPPDIEVPASFSEWLSTQPAQMTQSDGTPVTDVINFAFVGSREEVIRAFEASGWMAADALTPRTFARTYAAYTSMRAYRNAPVSSIYYADRLPELVFQKAFNSVAKRHHIRLWAADFEGTQVWLAAATHDTSAGFDWRRMSFTHRVDRAIDRERSKVLNDLTYAGCVLVNGLIQRPKLEQPPPADTVQAITDGAAAAVVLQDCTRPEPAAPQLTKRRRSGLALISRRIVLETRNYWTRSNAYYWAQRGLRWTISSLRPNGDRL
jgi:hypothetical protein